MDHITDYLSANQYHHGETEFSIWWREGKVPLPTYTQRRVTWWDHLPPLPFEVQIQSRSKDRHRIFDERFLYMRSIIKAPGRIRGLGGLLESVR
eukprot:s4291_g2.t1